VRGAEGEGKGRESGGKRRGGSEGPVKSVKPRARKVASPPLSGSAQILRTVEVCSELIVWL